MQTELTIGIVGAGSFAAFASKSFLNIKGVKIIAVADVNDQAGKKLSKELNAIFYSDYGDLLANTEIELVYIATPPFLHFEISKKALIAGKHVICEKPAALKTGEAETLQLLAKKSTLLFVVNLMQRYNPLYKAVKHIVQEKILGNFLHGYFENYASDENLDNQHWFWDDTKSGGIFIEHGVHFFDMFAGWLGPGKVINAVQMERPNTKMSIYDRVQATALYAGGTVNFYHAFDQPEILDRQELRLEFEWGDITLYEWIPVKMKLHALLKREQLTALGKLLGEHSFVEHSSGKNNKKAKGRFADILFDVHGTIESGSSAEKQERYRQLITDMLQDQWSWIRDKNHCRVIDDGNAVESLRMAEQATEIAQKI